MTHTFTMDNMNAKFTFFQGCGVRPDLLINGKWEPSWTWALLYNDRWGLEPLNEAMVNHMAFSFFRKQNKALSYWVGQPNNSHYSGALKTTSLFTCLVALFSDRQSHCLCKTMFPKIKVCVCGNEVAVVAVFRWFSNQNVIPCYFSLYVMSRVNELYCL